MTQKPKLEIGDRVAVYISGMRGTGEVTSAVGNLWVSLDEPMFTANQGQGECVTGKSVFVSPEQCRKLRPKQKPEKERVEKIWAKINVQMIDKQTFQQLDNRQFNFMLRDSGEFLEKLIKPLEGNGPLVCLNPGQVVLGREELARAWDRIRADKDKRQFFGTAHCAAVSYDFKELAEALGLGKDKA